MSAQLRAEARVSGWPEHIIRGLHVQYHPQQGFTTHVHPDHVAEAKDLEYGTPGKQPTYAIRRFVNRDSDRIEAENFLVERMYQHMEESIW